MRTSEVKLLNSSNGQRDVVARTDSIVFIENDELIITVQMLEGGVNVVINPVAGALVNEEVYAASGQTRLRVMTQ